MAQGIPICFFTIKPSLFPSPNVKCSDNGTKACLKSKRNLKQMLGNLFFFFNFEYEDELAIIGRTLACVRNN